MCKTLFEKNVFLIFKRLIGTVKKTWSNQNHFMLIRKSTLFGVENIFMPLFLSQENKTLIPPKKKGWGGEGNLFEVEMRDILFHHIELFHFFISKNLPWYTERTRVQRKEIWKNEIKKKDLLTVTISFLLPAGESNSWWQMNIKKKKKSWNYFLKSKFIW